MITKPKIILDITMGSAWRCLRQTIAISSFIAFMLMGSFDNVSAVEITHSGIVTVGGLGGSLLSLASWGFAAPLEASIFIHTAALWAADSVEVPHPPDPSYRETPRVVIPPAPTVPSDDRIDPSRLASANALLMNLATSIGTIRALDVAINRLNTATTAGDTAASALQRNYIFNTLLPNLQVATTAANNNLAQIAIGFRDATITSGQAQLFVAGVNANGFPPEDAVIFNLLQATPTERAAALMALNAADFSQKNIYSLRDDGLGTAAILMQSTVPYAIEDLIPVAVPEPSSFALLGVGIMILVANGLTQSRYV